MKDVKIRPLTTEDSEAIEELLKTRRELDEQGAQKRGKLLEWLAFHNPVSNGEPTYFIAEYKRKIIAHFV